LINKKIIKMEKSLKEFIIN
jgi:hypothetical protein